MQAVHHWDVLAEDVAKDVKLALRKEKEKKDPALLSKPIYLGPIYLEPHERSDFGEVFNTLLKTQLFNQKVELTKNGDNSLKLRYETQMVEHRAKRFTSPLYPGEPLLLTALGSGVYKAIADNSWALGAFATAGAVEVINDIEFEWTVPHHEIIITTELTDNCTKLTNNDTQLTDNCTIIHRESNIYYIQDADFWHYSESEEAEMPIKNYTCANE
jgi:hypothetical protein